MVVAEFDGDLVEETGGVHRIVVARIWIWRRSNHSGYGGVLGFGGEVVGVVDVDARSVPPPPRQGFH